MMQGYIGPYGRLFGFMQFKGDLAVGQEPRSNFETTLNGFVSEQRGPRRRRVWTGSLEGATYKENAQFKALADGFYGDPPFAMALPYQQVTNMLKPAQSYLEEGTWTGEGFTVAGGAFTTDGIYAGRSLFHNTGATCYFGYTDGEIDTPPLLPNQPVTYSAYLRGAGNIQLTWLAADNGIIETISVPYDHSTLQRAWVTATPPGAAVRPRMRASGVTLATLPAFTWTSEPLEWVPGNGVTKVSVGSLPETPNDSDDHPQGWRDSSLSYVITELG